MSRASRAAQLLMRAASWATQPLRLQTSQAGATRAPTYPWTSDVARLRSNAQGESIGGRLALERTQGGDAVVGSKRSAHSWESPPLGSEAARRATGQKTESWKELVARGSSLEAAGRQVFTKQSDGKEVLEFNMGQVVLVQREGRWHLAKVAMLTGDMVLVQYMDAPPGASVSDQQWLPRSSDRLRRALPDGAGGWVKPGAGWHVPSVDHYRDQYKEILQYVQKLDDNARVQGVHVLRWITALLLLGAGALYLVREDVREGLGKEGAEVTSRTIQDKKVQVAAELVAKEVALELLRSQATIEGAARFVKEVLAEPATRDAAGKLVVNLFRDEEMLAHTQEWVSVVVGRLCQEEATQGNIQHLLGVAFTNLFVDKQFQKTAGDFAVDVIAQDHVVSQATTLLTASVHSILDDPVVAEHTAKLCQDILGDPRIRKETASAVWSVMVTLSTLGLITPGKSVSTVANAETLAKQAAPDTTTEGGLRAPSAIIKISSPVDPSTGATSLQKEEKGDTDGPPNQTSQVNLKRSFSKVDLFQDVA